MEIVKELLPAQDDFVFSTEPFPAIIGGLGSGKTEGGITRLIKLFIEDRGISVAYYMPTYDLIRLRGIGGFEAILTQFGITFKTNKSDYTIRADGYGEIIFRSYERPERIIAYEVGHSLVDELDTIKLENAEIVWRKINERNRQKTIIPNSIGCVTTPDMGYNGFIYKKWFKEKQNGYVVYKASTYDNPFLPPEYVQNILNNYDPVLADLYLRGEIVSLNQNKVYHFYNRAKHYTNKTWQSYQQLHIGLDFNVGGTTATVCIIEDNKAYAVYELVARDTYDFINRLTMFKGKDISIYPDASGNSNRTNATQSDIAMIRTSGYQVFVNSQNPLVRDRINAMNGMFSHDRIYVNSDLCPNLANALETQGYDEKGEPEKWNTHPAVDDYNDNFGYFIAYRFPIIRQYTTAKLGGM